MDIVLQLSLHTYNTRLAKPRIPCCIQMLVKVTRTIAVGQSNGWLGLGHQLEILLLYHHLLQLHSPFLRVSNAPWVLKTVETSSF